MALSPLTSLGDTDWHARLTRLHFACEETLVRKLLAAHGDLKHLIHESLPDAYAHINFIRDRIKSAPLGEKMIHAFPLSSPEGVALMTLAEALFRIPDAATRNLLIANKLHESQWSGQDSNTGIAHIISGFMRLGKVFVEKPRASENVWDYLKKAIRPLVAPTARTAAVKAIRTLNNTFIMGQTIDEALDRAAKQETSHTSYSFDMLGEAATTAHEATVFFDAYSRAIRAVENAYPRETVLTDKPSISIKLSALHPRYEVSHSNDVLEHLYTRVVQLCKQAKSANVALAFDAEETARLELSLGLFQRILAHEDLQDWDGLGFVVQAYQKRALTVVDFLITQARLHARKIPVRLVKGAYWDNEIKWAQTEGVPDYPVFTRKETTDICYLACAQCLLDEALIYPQFATHNPLTVACIQKMAGTRVFEFQRLLGMGKELYESLHQKYPEIKCRIYAPIGDHKELLPYLVRRLLENGANTSFVNHVHNHAKRPEEIIRNPFDSLCERELRHTGIPLPKDIFGTQRKNAAGHSLSDYAFHTNVDAAIQTLPLPFVSTTRGKSHAVNVRNPATDALIGRITPLSANELRAASQTARTAAPSWAQTDVSQRARMLQSAANELERTCFTFIALLVKESGKTRDDALAEVREAVDFMRYYAQKSEEIMKSPLQMPGVTGESNTLQWHARGVFLCISPWNFPLAIFAGQLAAALATGNCVLAKPASATPFVAQKLVAILHKSGIARNVLQLIYADSKDVSATLLDPLVIDGISFTGATETAKTITRTLVDKEGPLIPLIAETGGQNAMIVDSSALFEQTVKDVIRSSFKSAGQRCSALRVLYIQDTIADAFIDTLIGAMKELTLGDPSNMRTDVGPLISKEARETLEKHVTTMINKGRLLFQADAPHSGHFMPPTLIEIDHINALANEAFGPILHIIRFKGKEIATILSDITATRYGLTLGLHTRISSRMDFLQKNARVGNLYINRDMIGAVVESQPFGGEGYSGTGFKAGGPHYLYRFLVERTCTINTTAQGGNVSLLNLEG